MVETGHGPEGGRRGASEEKSDEPLLRRITPRPAHEGRPGTGHITVEELWLHSMSMGPGRRAGNFCPSAHTAVLVDALARLLEWVAGVIVVDKTDVPTWKALLLPVVDAELAESTRDTWEGLAPMNKPESFLALEYERSRTPTTPGTGNDRLDFER